MRKWLFALAVVGIGWLAWIFIFIERYPLAATKWVSGSAPG